MRKKKKIIVTGDSESKDKAQEQAAGGSPAGAGDLNRDVDFSAVDTQPAPVQANGQASEKGPEVQGQVADSSGEAPEIVKLRREVEDLKLQLQDNKDKYLRALAEHDNYMKRSLRERSEYLRYQHKPVLFDLLNVVDNLERALEHAQADPAKVKEGVELIYKMFLDLLNKWEVRGESALGQLFDPTKHSALSRIKSGEVPAGTVLSQFKKAYFYKDQLLRAADVVVAVEPDPPAAEASGETAAEKEGSGPGKN